MGDITPINTREQRLQLWRDKLAAAEAIDRDLEQLSIMKSKLNKQKGAIYDEVETNGIMRNAFREVLRQRKLEVEKREKFRASYEEGAAANGWAQMDAFGYSDLLHERRTGQVAEASSDDEFLEDLKQRLEAG